MTAKPRRRPPYNFEPETMTWAEAAAVACRATESWLRSHIGDLEGFPRPDPALDVFSGRAIRAWVARRFGLVTPETDIDDAEHILIRRANDAAAHKTALPRRQTAKE
jgi:hypothetical protein